MNIHLVVVAHSLADDLLRLFEAGNAENVMWHLFLHSSVPAVVQACEQIVAEYPNLYYYGYKTNRGLAKSWNEGLLAGYRDGADVVMIANDDCIPGPGDVQTLAKAALKHRQHYMVTGAGFDVRSMVHTHSRFALGAINPIALETIGCFDENFFPIYWEDVDWYRRAALAGQTMHVIDGTCIIHMGSRSVHSNPALARQNAETYRRNYEYYLQKWGGETGKERFRVPFNDPQFDLRISPHEREKPYPGYDREDQGIVKL